MNPTLSVIIPAYNEGASIAPVLRALERELHVAHEILVVCDDPGDDTIPVLETLRTDMPELRRVLNPARGVLNGMRHGLAAARGDFIAFTTADGSDEAADIERMLALAGPGIAVVAGSRYMRGGRQLGGHALKKLLSRLAGLSLHRVGGIPTHDATNNFKLYPRWYLESVRIESRAGFELALELTVKAHRMGYGVVEVPTVWHDRSSGKSHFRFWSWLPHYLRWWVLGLTARLAPRALRSTRPT